MKIAFVSSTFPPYEGGIGNACYHTARQFTDRGHDVTVFLPAQAMLRPGATAFPFSVQYLPPFFSIGNASVLPGLYRALAGFDVIHLYYPFFGSDIFVWMAARKHHIPYFVSYQQDVYGDSAWKKTVFRVYNALLQKRIMNGAFRVLPLSLDHFNHSQIRSIVRRPESVHVIPNGVNIEDFEEGQGTEDIRKKYSIPPGRPVIAFNGALDSAHYFKRLDLLFQAVKLLPDQVHILVIGDGNLRPGLEKLADELGLHGRVTFLGRIPNKKISRYLHQVDVLVLPSTDTESFGIVLVEAMACRKPVIASDLHGVRATVEDGINGFVFRTGDATDLAAKIRSVVDNSQLAEKLGKQGYDIVKRRYTWSSIADELLKLYQLAGRMAK